MKNSALFSILITIIYALIIYFDPQSKIELTYTVLSEKNNITQLYWKTDRVKNVIHETRAVKATPEVNEVTYLIDRSTNKITIVPIITEHLFSISDLRLKYPGLILDISLFTTSKLELFKAIDTQNFSKAKNIYFNYQSKSTNPLLTFTINYKAHFVKNMIINSVIINLLLLIGRFLIKKSTIYNDSLKFVDYPAEVIFLLLPVFFLTSQLTTKFASPYSSISFISLFTIVVYISYVILVFLFKRQINVWGAFGFAIMIYILLPAATYKLSLLDKKIYSNIYTPIYHWRISKSLKDNLTNSGAAYVGDMAKIEEIIEPYSSYISDQATSYYLLSFLPLYSSFGKPHHGGLGDDDKSPFVSYAFLKYLCNSKLLFNNESIIEYMVKKTQLHEKMEWPIIKYIVLNKDRENKIVRRQCLTTNNQNVLKKVNIISDLIYQGEYLDLYEITLGN